MFQDKVVAITGAKGGIGRAFARMFAEAGAKVAICDLDAPQATAAELDVFGMACDVSTESGVHQFIDAAQDALGDIDIWVGNAGVGFGDPEVAASASGEAWETSWRVNVMQSVWAAQALLPGWVSRGHGRFVVVASAAGLLNQIGSASYSVTKAGAVALAENIAITHWADGIRAHAVCPQFVRTDMTAHMDLPDGSPLSLIEPEAVAESLRVAIAEDRVIVLPHEVVGKYARNKATDHQRWTMGMVTLQDTMGEALGLSSFKSAASKTGNA